MREQGGSRPRAGSGPRADSGPRAGSEPRADSGPRALILRIGAMGDILHGLPAIAAFRMAHPGAVIGWAVEPHWEPLVARAETASGQRVVDRLHPVPTREWKRRPCTRETLRELVLLRRDLQQQRYDIAIDLQGSIRSALIGRMAGTGRFTGLKRPRESQAKHLYSQRVAVGRASVIEQACELVGAALDTAPVRPSPIAFAASPEAETWCDEALRCLLPAGEKRFVWLVPGAGWGAKRWPVACFATLAVELRRRGLTVLFNSSPGAEPADELVQAGAHPLPCTVDRLLALSRRAALAVGGDTGPMHLAAALGVPTVALFGPTDPARNGPHFVGARTRMLRHGSSVLDHRRHAETEPGLAAIPVAQVLAAAESLLAEGGVHG